jgi:EamA domain-containing membrane protein RarD
MLCGTLPSTQLLHKYGLPQLYVDIVESLRYGDLPRYEHAMADPGNADWLLRRGLWMVVQALRVVVQARFFRHVKKLNEEVRHPQPILYPVLAARQR